MHRQGSPTEMLLTTEGSMTMLVVEDDAAAILAGIDLPDDAAVVVVSSQAESIRKVRVAVGEHAGGVVRFRRDLEAEKPQRKPQGVMADAYEPDARSRALLAGVRMAQDDLRDAGGAFDLDEVRVLLHGISRQAIDKRVQEGTLLAVPGPGNRKHYPTLQFTRDGSLVPGLREVRAALPATNPWFVLNFLSRPDHRLGGRKPIDVLKGGEIDQVVEAARRYGEQGA